MAQDLFDLPGVDELFELEPSQFTKARNALAKRLKRDHDGETAKQVKRLRRPTKVAWALNQVARREPRSVEDLLDVTDAVREAQASALEEGESAALREAMSKRRTMIRGLAEAAADLVGQGKRDAAAATVDAASLDDDGRQRLREGRLAKTLDPPSGFGLADMPEPRTKTKQRSRNRRKIMRLERDLHRIERRVDKARQRAERAEQQVAKAQAAEKSAKSSLSEVEKERDVVAGELKAAKR